MSSDISVHALESNQQIQYTTTAGDEVRSVRSCRRPPSLERIALLALQVDRGSLAGRLRNSFGRRFCRDPLRLSLCQNEWNGWSRWCPYRPSVWCRGDEMRCVPIRSNLGRCLSTSLVGLEI